MGFKVEPLSDSGLADFLGLPRLAPVNAICLRSSVTATANGVVPTTHNLTCCCFFCSQTLLEADSQCADSDGVTILTTTESSRIPKLLASSRTKLDAKVCSIPYFVQHFEQ